MDIPKAREREFFTGSGTELKVEMRVDQSQIVRIQHVHKYATGSDISISYTAVMACVAV